MRRDPYAVRRPELEPRTSRPQAGLLLTRVSLALGRLLNTGFVWVRGVAGGAPQSLLFNRSVENILARLQRNAARDAKGEVDPHTVWSQVMALPVSLPLPVPLPLTSASDLCLCL